MKFANCEESVVKSNDEKTFTEVASLEMFDPYSMDLEEKAGCKRFIFNGFFVALTGIPVDYKVYFGIEGDDLDLEKSSLVGERVFGCDYNINDWLYGQMMKAIRENNITL